MFCCCRTTLRRSGIFFCRAGICGFFLCCTDCFCHLFLRCQYSCDYFVLRNCLGNKSNIAENNILSLDEQYEIIHRSLAFVLIFPKNCSCAHIWLQYLAGKTKINWKKNTWKVVSSYLLNRVPTSLYTSFVSVNFGKSMTESCPAFGCTNWRSTTSLQFYRISSAKRYPEQRITKWVTAKKNQLRK